MIYKIYNVYQSISIQGLELKMEMKKKFPYLPTIFYFQAV